MNESSLQRSKWSTAVAVVFALVSVAVAEAVNRTVIEPYLARAYCTGHWKQWDPKLTTPPGLYLLSVAMHRVIPTWLLNAPCESVPYLRSTNLVLLMCAPHISASIIRRVSSLRRGESAATDPPPYAALERTDCTGTETVQPTRKPSQSTTAALQKAQLDPIGSANSIKESVSRRAQSSARWAGDIRADLIGHVVTALPPLWFFGLLYYTDVGSLVMVLACQLAALNDHYAMSAAFGAVSLLFRQTNVIWVLFVVFTSLASRLRPHGFHDPLASDSDLFTVVTLLSTGISALSKRANVYTAVSITLPYMPVLLGFIAFIRLNGGIVLGDKSNHQVASHIPQLFYFAAFSVIFGWPALIASAYASPTRLIRQVKDFSFGSPARILRTVVILFAITAAVHYKTYEHPFLLADNRHYTFYIWRRIIKVHPLARYFLAPVYFFCGSLWWTSLAHTQSLTWMLGFMIAISLTLVPSPLLEPRYFLVAYVLMRLHLATPDISHEEENAQSAPGDTTPTLRQADTSSREWSAGQWQLLLVEALWYLSLNALTVYVFLFRPFRWPSEDGWQRFMW